MSVAKIQKPVTKLSLIHRYLEYIKREAQLGCNSRGIGERIKTKPHLPFQGAPLMRWATPFTWNAPALTAKFKNQLFPIQTTSHRDIKCGGVRFLYKTPSWRLSCCRLSCWFSREDESHVAKLPMVERA